MTVSIANTALNNNFNSWRLNTNYMATVISNNAVTVNPGGDANRGGYAKGDGHVDGTFSGTTLKTDTLKGGNTSVSGTLTIESNTHITGTATNFFTVDANTEFTANVDFAFDSVFSLLTLPDVSKIRIASGDSGQFLRRFGGATDTVEFKDLTMRDLTETTLNSAHLYLSGANTDWISNGDSPVLSFSNPDDEIRIYLSGTTNNDSDLFVQLASDDGDSRLVVVNSSNTIVAHIGADGNADFTGTLNVDAATTLNSDVTLGDADTDTITVKGVFANQSTSGPAVFNGTTTFNDTMYINGNVQVGDHASDTLTVTSTSSFDGNTTIGDSDADTLTVNSRVVSHLIANGAYDLGSSTLEWRDLYIDGTAHIDTLDVDENASVDGTLTVTGQTTLNGGLVMDTTAFTVADTTGDVHTDGTLDVDGATTLNGAVTLGDADADVITVKGHFANQSTSGTADFNGDVNLGSDDTDTITVKGVFANQSTSGTADFNGTSNFNGTTNMNGTLNINGNVNVGDAAADAMTVTATSSMQGNTTIGSDEADTLTVNARVMSHLVANGSYDLGTSTLEWRDLYIDGTAHIDTLDVDENASVDGTLTVTGQTTLNGGVTADGGVFTVADTTGDVHSSGSLDVDGSATLNDDVTVGENLRVSGNTFIGSDSNDFLTVNAKMIGGLTANGTINLGENMDSFAALHGGLGTDEFNQFKQDEEDTLNIYANTIFHNTVTINTDNISLSGSATLSSLDVTGSSTLGSGTSDNLTINAMVQSDIVAETSGAGAIEHNLGTAADTWTRLYANTVYIANSIVDSSENVIIGSNGTLHANNTIQANNIHGYMLEDTSVTDDLDQFTADGAITQTTTFGSSTKIPVLTIDRKGRIVAASNSDVAGVDSFSYASDTQTLTIGLATDTDLTATIGAATTTSDGTGRGVASFSSDNFSISSGHVSIKDNGITLGTETTGNYVATISGTSNEISVSGSGSETAAVTIGLPDSVSITDDLSVGGQLSVSENVVISGNLVVSGTTTTVSTTNMEVEDALIALQAELTGSNTNDIGIVFNRGSEGSNGIFIWDESSDKFWLGTGATGADRSGAVTGAKAELDATIAWSNLSGVPTYDNYSSWTISDSTNTEAIGSGDTLKFGQNAADEITVAYTAANNTMMITHDGVTRTNTTSSSTATHSGTQTVVDSITTNARGHVTGVNTKTITFPGYSVPTLDNVCDQGSTTDQTITAADFITAGDYTALANSGIIFGENNIDTIDYTSWITDTNSSLLIKTSDRNGSGNPAGPNITVDVGNGNGSGDGGNFNVTAGAGGASGGDGGYASLSGGRYDNNSHSGAYGYFFGGSSGGGGNVQIGAGGASSASVAGGSIQLSAGSGRNSTNANVPGSEIWIYQGLATGVGGSATWTAGGGVGTNIAGGDITVKAGVGTGTGDPGQIAFQASASKVGSGSTAQTLENKAYIDENGLSVVKNLNLTVNNGLSESQVVWGHNGDGTGKCYMYHNGSNMILNNSDGGSFSLTSGQFNFSGVTSGSSSSNGGNFSVDASDSLSRGRGAWMEIDGGNASGIGGRIELYAGGSRGVSDIAGADIDIKGGAGTGTGTPGSVTISTYNTTTSGTTEQTSVDTMLVADTDAVWLKKASIGGSASSPAYTLPTVDGTNGYVLKTNGSGTVSWQADTNTNTDTLQSIALDATPADQYISFVPNNSGAQTGRVDPGLTYNPFTNTLKTTYVSATGSGNTLYVGGSDNTSTGTGGGLQLYAGTPVGTNIAGSDITITAGPGTGTGSPGDIVFNRYYTTSSGSSLGAQYQVAILNGNGLDVAGNVSASTLQTDNYIRHDNDIDTYIYFTSDRMQVYCGNVEMIDCVEGTTDYVDIIDRVRVTAFGDLECEGDVVAYTSTSISDINQKENITKIDSALDKVSKLNGYTFDWKNTGESSAGVIAQEVEEVLPEIVKEKTIRDGDPHKTVEYNGLVGVLIEAMKEQQDQIAALRTEIDELKANK